MPRLITPQFVPTAPEMRDPLTLGTIAIAALGGLGVAVPLSPVVVGTISTGGILSGVQYDRR